MASTIIQVFSPPNVPAAQLRRAPKVTLSRPGYALVTLPITDPRVEASDLAADWGEQKRPGNSPLLGLAGTKLQKRRLTVTVDEDVLARMAAGAGAPFTNLNPGGLAEACIAAIVDLAKPGPPVVVAYSNLEAGVWRISDLSYTTTRRHTDNRVLTAEVSMQLTEAADPPPIAIAPAAPPPIPAAAAAPAPTQGDARRYTVKKGDTLWVIAQRTYGNGNVWTKIADANGIRDPRKLAVGQVLTLP